MSVLNYFDKLDDFNKFMKEAPLKLSEYEIEKIVEVGREFFKRLDFQVGKEVVLIKTPVINFETAPGWMSSKGFLIKGAKGIIKEVDFYKGKVRVGVKFHDQDKGSGMHVFEEDFLIVI